MYETQTTGICTPGSFLQFWRSIDDGQTFLPVGIVDSDLKQLRLGPGFRRGQARGRREHRRRLRRLEDQQNKNMTFY
jgi:hypothetical protein